MATTDGNNCISSNLRADIMRCSMENKNLLTTKGSIYVGAGSTVSVGGQSIPKTKALALGAEGAVLMSKNGDLAYSKLTNDNFDGSTNYSNLINKIVLKSALAFDQVKGSFSNLMIGKDNFLPTRSYSKLVRVSPSIAQTSWGATFTFAKGSSGMLELNCTSLVGPLVRYSIYFTGVYSSDGAVKGGILHFDYIMQKNYEPSINDILQAYLTYYGFISGSGTSWSGWCLPSFISQMNEGQEGPSKIYRSPLYITTTDGNSFSFKEETGGLTLYYSTVTMTQKQIF